MYAIRFSKFDEHGNFKCSNTSTRKYTVREAMQHLEDNGFKPLATKKKKLYRVYGKRGYIAHII